MTSLSFIKGENGNGHRPSTLKSRRETVLFTPDFLNSYSPWNRGDR